MNNVSELTNVASELFIDWAIISMSFVTLDKISPILCLSKYFNGNLFIFVLMFLLNFLANLLATSVIDIDSKYVNVALKMYNTSKFIVIIFIWSQLTLLLNTFEMLSGIDTSFIISSLESVTFCIKFMYVIWSSELTTVSSIVISSNSVALILSGYLDMSLMLLINFILSSVLINVSL